ncbi:hypothetical protein ACFP2T_01970 [Plantactinospora solaniradicis]|uniref:Uncharacterized protein n=1 Tax=Plantactinospora solaniradicis TaxID=1723736 RepID=A0ABW1K1V8_9ACTN
MGVLARWRAGWRATRRERILAAAAADEAEEATRARDRLLVTANLQRVTAGTALYLRAGEWRTPPDVPPSAYVDVRVSRLDERIIVYDGAAWVEGAGHLLECAWRDDDGHPPCLVVLARVDAILRAAQ